MLRNIFPIILIGIAIALFFTFSNPTYKDISSIKTQIASYDDALNNSSILKNKIDTLTNKYNSIDTNNLEKLEKLLPDGVDNIRLILEIEKLALPYGMILKDVKYATGEDKIKTAQVGSPTNTNLSSKNYGVWDLEFSTQGTYFNFVNFLKDVENNLRIVDIASVEFSAESNIGTGLNPKPTIESYKYNFKIKTYWLKN